jgi:diacylglycerol kinase family enzyme
MPTNNYDFDSVVVVTNPASRNAALANKRIAELQQFFPGCVHILETDPDLLITRQALLNVLAKQVHESKRSVLAIAGGDGTVNLVLRILVGPAIPDHIRKIPIVPLGTGHANDLAFMLYDDPSNLEHTIHKGHVVDMRPLECLIAAPGAIPERHVAASYMSFGATARGAYELNRPEVRKHAKVKTWYGDLMPEILAVRAATLAPTFKIEQDNKSYLMRDILIGNGDRIAKHGKLPTRLDRLELYVNMTEASWIGRSAIPLGAIKLALGMLPGKLLQDKSFTFTTLDKVTAQFDGEPVQVAAGSGITIAHTKATFLVLATRDFRGIRESQEERDTLRQ